MLISFGNMKSKKGQGIVEYAVLLAFVVGLAAMLNGTNISGTVKNTFDNVAVMLGAVKDYASAVKNWGGKAKTDLESEIENQKRLSVDQEGLANLGGFFIGKDKSFIQSLLKDTNKAKTDQNLMLGWFYVNDDGGTSFTMQKNPGEALEHFKEEQRNYIEGHVFNWLQHDYGSYSEGAVADDSYNTNYDSQTKYFFSDYALNTEEDSKTNSNNRKGGVKLKLKYDGDTVVAAKVVMDSFEQQKGDSTKNRSAGLEVTVSNDGKFTESSGFKDFPK